MIDSHVHPDHWGIQPILFNIGNLQVPAYSFFVLLGLIVGLVVYAYESKRRKLLNDDGVFIAFGAILGGVIGAKILEFAINIDFVLANLSNPVALMSGRTIVGGLIGGTVGVMIVKKLIGSKERRGNMFAPAIALGVAIGRLGCFFVGCCYGKATSLPWGVDFGDHILRHPTQIYESIFMLGMFIYLERIKNREDVKPGQLFKTLMLSYFTFRFLIEFIRVEPVIFMGLTVFQIICVGVIVYLARDDINKLIYKVVKRYVK